MHILGGAPGPHAITINPTVLSSDLQGAHIGEAVGIAAFGVSREIEDNPAVDRAVIPDAVAGGSPLIDGCPGIDRGGLPGCAAVGRLLGHQIAPIRAGDGDQPVGTILRITEADSFAGRLSAQ